MSRPLTIEEALSRAKKAAKQGKSDVAAQLFAAILQQEPNHPVARKGLRKLQSARGSSPKSRDPSQQQMNALIQLYSAGRLDEAEGACRSSLQTFPNSVLVANLLGSVLQAQGKFEEAVSVFDGAIRILPGFAEAHSNRGNALKGLGRLEESVASYDRAIELKPDMADAWHNRANALKDLGILDDAIASYEEAVSLRPNFAEAHRSLSALKTFEANDRQVTLMERALMHGDLPDAARTEILFALAKAYEDLGEYDRCFEYLEQGNRLRRNALNFDIEDDKNLFARIKTMADGDIGPAAAPESAPVTPLFIVGMMRSGTSLVEQILASHSDVHGAGELETMNQLIVPRLSSMDIDAVRAGYLKALSALNVSERFITDKMPLNFRWLGIILAALPEARIIHVTRDPRAVCWSIYKHYFPDEGNAYAYGLQDLVEYHALYEDLMSFWRERHADRIYDLCYEDLTRDQEQETRKLLAFCDLDWQEQCLDFHKTRRAVKTISASQVRRKMYQGSSDAWKQYEHHLQPLIDGLGNRYELV